MRKMQNFMNQPDVLLSKKWDFFSEKVPLSILKKFSTFFIVRVPPFSENWVKFFSHQNIKIYTPIDSPCRV
jgi:hypothetical protein